MKPTIYKEVTKGHYELLKKWYESPQEGIGDDENDMYVMKYSHVVAIIELLIAFYEESSEFKENDEN